MDMYNVHVYISLFCSLMTQAQKAIKVTRERRASEGLLALLATRGSQVKLHRFLVRRAYYVDVFIRYICETYALVYRVAGTCRTSRCVSFCDF